MNIVIMHDHIPDTATPDQLDTLVQVDEMDGLLSGLGHQVQRLAMGSRLDETVAMIRFMHPDVVFNLVESLWGQGRWIHLAPSILEQLGIPFTGNGSNAIGTTTNKLKAKEILVEAGLPTPDWFIGQNLSMLPENRARWIIKSVTEHASTGLDEDSVLSGKEPERIGSEMDRRRQALGGDCFVEKYIPGREFNLALLDGPEGPEVLPPAEIRFEGYGKNKVKVVGYRAKWDTDSFEYQHTARTFAFERRDRRLLDRLNALSMACWDLFGLSGWARVDFRVDSKGRPFILEVNANPCLSSDAGFMAAAHQAGYDPSTVVRRIIEKARGTQVDFSPVAVESLGLTDRDVWVAAELDRPGNILPGVAYPGI